MDIDDICIDFKKKDLMMKLIFFKNKYNKIFLIMGNKKNRLYCDSYQELKTDVECLCEHVFKSK